MNIGEAASASGVTPKMIRYYETIGLVNPGRTGANYRVYGADDVHRLRFIRRARSLGFSMEETQRLLALWDDKERASGEVKRLASAHIADLNRKIAEMQGMVDTLSELVACCHGDHRPNCPILTDLAGGEAPARRPRGAART
ncbi:Cu(I)-responsive transcriptional regulator [Pseudomonas sp. R2.Fl]|nr:Cu(I)-responsive transcriptional regulator [Pseudomonas sp. R2.Fl]